MYCCVVSCVQSKIDATFFLYVVLCEGHRMLTTMQRSLKVRSREPDDGGRLLLATSEDQWSSLLKVEKFKQRPRSSLIIMSSMVSPMCVSLAALWADYSLRFVDR